MYHECDEDDSHVIGSGSRKMECMPQLYNLRTNSVLGTEERPAKPSSDMGILFRHSVVHDLHGKVICLLGTCQPSNSRAPVRTPTSILLEGIEPTYELQRSSTDSQAQDLTSLVHICSQTDLIRTFRETPSYLIECSDSGICRRVDPCLARR